MLQPHNRTMFTILSLVILLFFHSIQADTSLYLWGVPFTANNTQPNVLSPTRFPHDKVSSFVQIESGVGHTLLLTRDGKVFSMGGKCCVLVTTIAGVANTWWKTIDLDSVEYRHLNCSCSILYIYLKYLRI